jgi:hypothetical protein
MIDQKTEYWLKCSPERLACEIEMAVWMTQPLPEVLSTRDRERLEARILEVVELLTVREG